MVKYFCSNALGAFAKAALSTHYTCLFDYSNHVSKSQHLGSRYSILSFSNLDRFVRSFCNDYRRTAVKLFLAQRVAFGVIDVIVFTDVLFRMLLIVGTQPPISYRTSRSERCDISFSTEMAGYLAMLMRVSAVYFWAFVRGWS